MTLFPSYSLRPQPTRSLFISYHHDRDQAYYGAFSRTYSSTYGVVRDNSLDRFVDSDDPEYVMRRIRENYITGTSCTIVLCGPYTQQRKYVDWEIKATLDKGHGLIGVQLPNLFANSQGLVYLPTRLNANIKTGYALWITWSTLVDGGALNLKRLVEAAISRPNRLIINPKELKTRNG